MFRMKFSSFGGFGGGVFLMDERVCVECRAPICSRAEFLTKAPSPDLIGHTLALESELNALVDASYSTGQLVNDGWSMVLCTVL
jgi:hypothetical protein